MAHLTRAQITKLKARRRELLLQRRDILLRRRAEIIAAQKKRSAPKPQPLPVEKKPQPISLADLGKGNPARSVADAAISLARGAAGQVAGGVAGAVVGLNPFTDAKAGDTVNAVQSAISGPPVTPGGVNLLKALGAGVSGAEKIGNLAGSGLAGIASLLSGSDLNTARLSIDQTKREGLLRRAGGVTLAATGSPLLATAVNVAPQLAALAATSGALPKTALRGPALRSATRLDAASANINLAKKAVVAVLRKGDPAEIAAVAAADPELFKAVDALKINAPVPASVSSANPRFQTVSGALEARQDSPIAGVSAKFSKAASDAADKIITDAGGSIDSGDAAIAFKQKITDNIASLGEKADIKYGELRKFVPETSRHAVPEAISVLRKLKRSGSAEDSFITSLSRDLFPSTKTIEASKILGPKGAPAAQARSVQINPLMGRIDLVRRNLGRAINKAEGPFRNSDIGSVKLMYSALTKDTQAIAEQAGGEALKTLKDANKLIVERKALEKSAIKLLGRDLSTSVVRTAGQAIASLIDNPTKFQSIVENIPKEDRAAVLSTAMNKVLSGAKLGEERLSPTRAAKFLARLSKAKEAKKLLFDSLPADTGAALDNLFTVVSGISRARRDVVRNGSILALFDPERGLIAKMVGTAGKAVVKGAAVATGTKADAAVSAIGRLIKSSDGPSEAAAKLIASPDFGDLLRETAKDGSLRGGTASKASSMAEGKVMRTEMYRKWAKAIKKQQGRVVGASLITFLFGGKKNG